MGNLPVVALVGIVVGSIVLVCLLGVCVSMLLPERPRPDDHNVNSFRRSSASTSAQEKELFV